MSNDNIKKSVVDLVSEAIPEAITQPSNNTTVTISNSVFANNIDLSQRTNITIIPGKDHISERQAAELKRLVDIVVRWEHRVRPYPASYGKIWKALNRQMGVTSYRLIPIDRFDDAWEMLTGWANLLASLLDPPQEDKDWYIRKYSLIFNHVGRLGLRKRFSNHLKERYNVDHMTDLSAKDLMSAYQTVTKWIFNTWIKGYLPD